MSPSTGRQVVKVVRPYESLWWSTDRPHSLLSQKVVGSVRHRTDREDRLAVLRIQRAEAYFLASPLLVNETRVPITGH
jgi:hypothetical protein